LSPTNITDISAKSNTLLSRDLSWLEFNARVLHEAIDARTPLLERLRFLSIYSSNLDEFFMKRVGAMRRQVMAGVTKSHGPVSTKELLVEIRRRVLSEGLKAACYFNTVVRPELEKENIFFVDRNNLTNEEKAWLHKYFRENVFSMLTPLSVDPGHPFPFLSNLSLSLGVLLSPPDQSDNMFARVKIPASLPQWVQLGDEKNLSVYKFIGLKDVIWLHLQELFPKMTILKVMPFRITRNVDLERDEDEADDLLEMIEEELRQRKFARIVRVEHEADPDPWIINFIKEELELGDEDAYESVLGLEYSNLNVIADLPIAKHKFRIFNPVVPSLLLDDTANIFNVIRRNDVLLHHPFESFTASVERFITEAAEDPKVYAIKMTLYRTGDDSQFVRTLIRAAEMGKHVVVVIELKARFDEKRNISWAQQLENAGAHVVYGVVGLKTHCKMALVVRRDNDGLRSYVHIGTGNYHSTTSKLYTDMGLITCKPLVADDVVEVFHYLTGRSLKEDYNSLLVAPVTMKNRFLALIQTEIDNSLSGKPAHIIAKMNSLEDEGITSALYAASQAGVKVQLIVRGFCVLRPGVKGLSENISVQSIIGRYLEHSRIFFFRNGKEDPVEGLIYIGSADWMYRNLQNRVEVVTVVNERSHRERILETLQLMLADQRQTWEMDSEGTYLQRSPRNDYEAVGIHERLMVAYSERLQKTLSQPEKKEYRSVRRGRKKR